MTKAHFIETRLAKFYLTEQPTNCPQVGDHCQHRAPYSLPLLDYGSLKTVQGDLGQIIHISNGVAEVLWTPSGVTFNAPAFRRPIPLTELLKVDRVWK